MHGAECLDCEHRKKAIVCNFCKGFDLFEPLDESLNFNDEDDRLEEEE